ncbi:MAG: hypothetical protein RLZ92_1644 [Pseudomonadota bacterium]|jgi:hypothetical protein
MSKSAKKDDRKKVALDLDVYETLKNFSRHKGLKLRHLIAAMTDITLSNDALSKQIVNLAMSKGTDEPKLKPETLDQNPPA